MDLNPITQEQISLIRSLFKGREDVFAVRWEKGKKSGYMPAYFYDPYRYKLHRIKGGTFKNYRDKSYKKLTDNEVLKHLDGTQHIGIYPLLPDNTSWFIAADFDKENWEKECTNFMEICRKYDIPAYLERSRSGNGGHVWIFFKNNYPAQKSRKFCIWLLTEAKVFSVFDKSSSFDRLFPNQDFHSGKGLGNLIALPLNKHSFSQGNSCFIDPVSFEPYQDQWKYLSQIKRASLQKLDQLFQIASKQNDNKEIRIKKGNTFSTKLIITLDEKVILNRTGLTPPVISFLKENLNFINSEYIIKKKMGKSTWGTEQFFNLIEEQEHLVLLPRGFIGALIRFCRTNKIEHIFKDDRKKRTPCLFSTSINSLPHQKKVIETASKKEFGVIVAPPGSGKTIMALKIIKSKEQPALIVVHRKQLADQWIERIEAFLGIPKKEIGKIGQGKQKIGERITVAMVQTLGKKLESPDSAHIVNAFGIIIVDECHHIPALSFRKTISKLKTYYQYGLTATPFRKNNDDKLIFAYLGNIISEIKPNEIESFKKARVIVRNTSLDVPFNSKTDQFETLSKILIHDTARNHLIISDVKEELISGHKVIIITERKDHLAILYQFLKQTFEVLTLSGDDKESDRNSKWKLLKTGNYQVLITTGQYFGEGTDLSNVSRLFLVYPFAFKGKLIQYIGRVQRSEVTPLIYDYRDHKVTYLEKLFLKRNTYYRKLDKQASLFEDIAPLDQSKTKVFNLSKKIKIPISELDFRFGSIAFNYKVAKWNTELEFEIEHDEMLPEFDVLKPYFSNVLKAKSINVDIQAEFENNILHSQLASSEDLDKINNEVIEVVKFRLLEKRVLNREELAKEKANLAELDQILSGKDESKLFESESQIIETILANKQSRHFRQLKYLAKKHDYETLKIRFVLNPFSFVFLLTGEQYYHIVLETLDTEEATYIWHIEKNEEALKLKLIEIDKHLATIKEKGRKHFLQQSPEYFNKLIHDYRDERKGFIKWKFSLEEQLV